ncbi:hypothetical protein LLH06_03870 [Mucilaginibacter daejeonensis]|uniref:hypothetical protein n=1 Tax=Mucilaginibacter daejeonensis TaxID=398049 RepID=UPI001D1755CE|nr:hypothetical protein [Mucilaginibacter daejeonensis]UEG54106.1 hypothetical protein LLH06_03870 [Mucilaginibacter daejeonensis]
MDETSTNFFNAITNEKAMVEGIEVKEHTNADELLFHHALRTELDTLQLDPSRATVEKLLNYSKSLSK